MQQATKDEALKIADTLRNISNQELMMPVHGFPKQIMVSELIEEVENLTEIGQAFIVGWRKSTDVYNKKLISVFRVCLLQTPFCYKTILNIL